jgi:hypothetical protein
MLLIDQELLSKNKARDITLPNFKIYYIDRTAKVVCYCTENRYIEYLSKIESQK